MFRKRAIWAVLGILVGACVWFAATNFDAASPIVRLDLAMDREAALDSAANLAVERGWGPQDFRQAASFRQDDREVQMYVELEAGGREAFQQMLDEGAYQAYVWAVRHFREGDATETEIRFTSTGKPYGFRVRLPEDEAGASIPAGQARAIAEGVAEQDWGLDLRRYALIESSQETRPGGRTDHWFVYQRTDLQVEDARYRVRLGVAGDEFSELIHFVHVPEGFTRRFAEMRSRNEMIALGAGVAAVLLFVVGGTGLGLFFLLRTRWVVWRAPLVLGVGVALLVFLSGLNELPLSWMFYDTAVSAQGFRWQQIGVLAAQFLGLAAFFTVVVMAAESLSRRAFPDQIQLWRVWSRDAAGSDPMLGRTLGGYSLAALGFAFVVAFYLVVLRLPGWWSPSDTLLRPDLLATNLPSLSAIALALQAGVWEESLFRAIPIACAALIGIRFGGKRIWIGSAVIVQALVFAAAHADYPQQPAYARVLEIFPDAAIWGVVYLLFGLVPVILAHFTYNLVWSSLPLFVAEAPGLWLNRGLIIAAGLTPLAVVVYSRLRYGARAEAPASTLNRAWAPAPVTAVAPPEEEPEPARPSTPVGPMARRGLVAAAAAGLVLFFVFTPFRADSPRLTPDRRHAIEAARTALAEQGIELTERWQPLASVHTGTNAFVWRVGGREAHQELLGSYVPGPRWRVRFATFEGPVEERAEEYIIEVTHDGRIGRFRHQLPESRPGATLDEEDARTIAETAVAARLDVDPASLREVSAVADRHPERQDWIFTFADPQGYPLDEGEARIRVVVAGDQVSDIQRYVHVPEEWTRARRADAQRTMIISIASSILFVLLLAGGAAFGVVRWSHGGFPARVTLIVFATFFGVQVLAALNGWPAAAANFSTDQPFRNQAFALLAGVLVSGLLVAAPVALVAGFVHRWPGRRAASGASPILVGSAAGAAVAGLAALGERLTPSLTPFAPPLDAAATFVPAAALAVQPLSSFLLSTAALLLILRLLDGVSRGGLRRMPVAGALAVIAGLMVAGLTSPEGVGAWLAIGGLTGAALLAVYWLTLRFDPALVPVFAATIAVLREVQFLVLQPHAGALLGPAGAIVLLGTAALLWSRALGSAAASGRS